MKDLIYVLILLSSIAFSQDVYRLNDSTFVYPCITTAGSDLNFVGLPFETDWTMATDFDLTGVNVNAVSKWNTELQGWETSGYHSALGWGTDFPVETGGAYMINAVNDFDFTVTGDSVDVVYDLITTSYGSLNMIVYPLGQPTMTTESLAGAIGPCNSLSRYDNVIQKWDTSSNMFFDWLYVFNVYAGMPLFLNITASTTWPSAGKVENNSDDLAFDNKTTKGAGAGPRIVYYHIQNEVGSELSFPEDEWLVFNVWITGREAEVRTQESVGFGYSMIDGNSVAYLNIGNFSTLWSPGEELNIEFPLITKLDQEDSFIIPEGSGPIYRCFEPLIPGTGTPLQILTSSIDDRVIPTETTLHQNYPNPFNPTTTISFSIPTESQVKLSVFNIEGQLVKELVNGKMDKGIHNIDFNAESYISGEYIYTLEANEKKISNKMLLVK
ncbi:MAG: T9SS type A sorting domain-containing protein [Candidatus Delongbacteria bacterium]|nr:T9SS type A sorting domain-containing protein [Candidatus Delongbacteria bacterium]